MLSTSSWVGSIEHTSTISLRRVESVDRLYRRRQKLSNHLGQDLRMRVARHVAAAFDGDAAGVGQALQQHLLMRTRHHTVVFAADEQDGLANMRQSRSQIDTMEQVRLMSNRRQARSARAFQKIIPNVGEARFEARAGGLEQYLLAQRNAGHSARKEASPV